MEEGAGLGVASGAEDAHEGFGGVAERGGEGDEADGAVDVHAEDGFGGVEVAGEEGVSGVDEEFATEGGILADERLGGLAEDFGEGHWVMVAEKILRSGGSKSMVAEKILRGGRFLSVVSFVIL